MKCEPSIANSIESPNNLLFPFGCNQARKDMQFQGLRKELVQLLNIVKLVNCTKDEQLQLIQKAKRVFKESTSLSLSDWFILEKNIKDIRLSLLSATTQK